MRTVEAIGKAGFTPGQDIALAIDAAASEFYADGAYNFEGSRGPRRRWRLSTRSGSAPTPLVSLGSLLSFFT